MEVLPCGRVCYSRKFEGDEVSNQSEASQIIVHVRKKPCSPSGSQELYPHARWILEGAGLFSSSCKRVEKRRDRLPSTFTGTGL